MSAKVYIVLCGENESSGTKQLQVPECTLFRKNSRDTFILSAADTLGRLRGVHVWHDNSGSSPDWYLKHIQVSEVTGGRAEGRRWLFVGECWLGVSKGDGRVERTLPVCPQRLDFTQMLRLKLSDYFTDFHIWASVYGRPRPNSFTHTQRLGVCLLLLLGYSCANAAIISRTDEQSPLEVGFVSLSALSLRNGLLSVAAVLPAATLMSFLFRRCGTETKRQHVKDVPIESAGTSEPCSSRRDEPALVPGKEALLYQGVTRDEIQTTSLASRGGSGEAAPRRATWAGGDSVKRTDSRCECPGVEPASRRCSRLAWTWCLLQSLSCLLLCAAVGMRFSSGDVLLWIHSLFVSLTSCIFLIQPAAILAVAAAECCWHAARPDVHSLSLRSGFTSDVSRSRRGEVDQTSRRRSSGSSLTGRSKLEARQRSRFLRHVQPPSPAELRKSRRKRRREALMQRTLRDLSYGASMFVLMACITCGCSSGDRHRLNTAVRERIVRNDGRGFTSIKKLEDLKTWTQTSLLDLLYPDPSSPPETHILIGEPILQTERSHTFNHLVSAATRMTPCGHLVCFWEGLGRTKSDAASKLTLLQSRGWLDGQTVALKVHFTLYSPAPNLFTGVTLLAEQRPAGVLLPAARVQSAQVFHAISAWDYVTMVCQLLFLFLSLTQLCHQVSDVAQQGLMGYWRAPSNWVESGLLPATLTYHAYSVYLSTLIVEVADQLREHKHRGAVDVSRLAACEQVIRTLRGVLLFLLALKCVTALRATETLAASAAVVTQSLSGLLRLSLSGLTVVVALSHLGNLLDAQRPGSSLTPLRRHQDLRSASGLVFSAFDSWHFGVVFLSAATIWRAAARAAVLSSVRSIKRSQKHRDSFTTTELVSHIRKKVSELTGRQKRPAGDCEEAKGCRLEEFESAVDELLFRLGALSDSLHHSLPPRAHPHTDEDLTAPSNREVLVNDQRSVSDRHGSDHEGALAPPHPLRAGRFQRGPEGVFSQHGGQRLDRQDRGWLSHTRATRRDVLVEVLIHKGPEERQ